MDGRRLPSSLLFNALTSPREAITSARRRRRYANSTNSATRPDRSFIDDQIVSHQEVLKRQELLMRTPGQNPQLLALAKEGTEEIRRNLAALRAIQKQLPPPEAPTGPFGLPPPPFLK
jgi:hypothetical protein